MIVQRGYRPAGNFHTPRLMAAPLGPLLHVMTNGYGAMPDYRAQVAPQDRWAIVLHQGAAVEPGCEAGGRGAERED